MFVAKHAVKLQCDMCTTNKKKVLIKNQYRSKASISTRVGVGITRRGALALMPHSFALPVIPDDYKIKSKKKVHTTLHGQRIQMLRSYSPTGCYYKLSIVII